ncbi:helix-turn-helix transcriptional regulator [Streptococcus suis]|nr:helix-turn-helix transcriptional regulator [Streptococcus suis]
MIELTLRDFRLKLGMTVDDMAEELNVHRQTYWYWEGKNKPPEEAMQKIRKIYDKTKEHMVDDGIDIIEKIGTIKRHYRLSYDSLAQLVGAKYGTSVVNWMNGVQPRLKYMIRINELYYEIVNKKTEDKSWKQSNFLPNRST